MSQFFRAPWTITSIVGIAMLTACGKTQPPPPPAASDKAPAGVATVNGTPIPRADFDAFVKSLLQGKQQELTPDQKNQVLDDLINTQLLSSEAVKDGTDKDPEVAARLDVLRLRILADAEVQKYLKAHQPTDAELHAEFDSETAATDMTEYHARHILLAAKDKELAVELIKKLKHGANFEDLAKAQSTDTSAKTTGGDLGWFNASHMIKPLVDAIKPLKKGEVAPEPVQTQYGWHIVKLEDTRPPTFDQANKSQLADPIMKKKLLEYIDSLKKDAKIDKHL